MTRCCPGCGRTDMAGITHICPPVETRNWSNQTTFYVHGTLPAPNLEQMLDPDPERFLAGGPLHEVCAGGEACDGLCVCEEGE